MALEKCKGFTYFVDIDVTFSQKMVVLVYRF